MEVQSNENAALLKLLKTKSRTKTELLKVSSARRRARQAALEALLAEGKVIRIDRKYFANDPSGSVDQLIDAEAARLESLIAPDGSPICFDCFIFGVPKIGESGRNAQYKISSNFFMRVLGIVLGPNALSLTYGFRHFQESSTRRGLSGVGSVAVTKVSPRSRPEFRWKGFMKTDVGSPSY